MASFASKRIPTILGILILGIGLVGGILLVNTRELGFLPRASPETTPKSMKITNVTDTSLAVSWITDSPTPGYIRYGSTPNSLTTTVTDDRDQLSGSVGLSRTHHVTIRSLSPNTTYYFKIGTGTSELYDNNGAPYETKTTGPVTGASKTLYGVIQGADGAPAAGAIIYVTGSNIAPLSALSQSTGSFVISLSNARTTDLRSAAVLSDETGIALLAVSPFDDRTSIVNLKLSQAQPVPDIILGKNQEISTAPIPETSIASAQIATASAVVQSKFSSQLLSPATESIANRVSINSPTIGDTISESRPTFSGTATASASIKLSVVGPTAFSTTIRSNSSGAWTYRSGYTLKNGQYTLTASTAIGKSVASTSAQFSILVPTATPKVTASGSSQVSHEASESALPVTGSMETTVALSIIAMILIGSGILWSVATAPITAESAEEKTAS